MVGAEMVVEIGAETSLLLKNFRDVEAAMLEVTVEGIEAVSCPEEVVGDAPG